MLSLGPMTLLAPLALLGLIALPVLWLVLRATPPVPRRRVFPPLRLLLGLPSEEETPERTPWWLILLRMLIATLIVLGLSRPVLFPPAPPPGEGPLVLVVDDGWAARPNWERMVESAEARLDAARQDDRQAALVFTTTRLGAADDVTLLDPSDARDALTARTPAAWPPDRAATAARIEAAIAEGALPGDAAPVWIADGLDHASDEEASDAAVLQETLVRLGPGEIVAPATSRGVIGVRRVETTADGFAVTVVRAAPTEAREGVVTAFDAEARPLTRAGFLFEEGETTARAEARLPLELRNRIAHVRLEAGGSAGGAYALDDGWLRPLIGLAASAADEDIQPLLADLHYIERALDNAAELTRGSLRELIEAEPGAIVLSDAGRIVGPDAAALSTYVNDGGLLIRFAGPRLEERSDELVPTPLREGGRTVGGALGWDEPLRLRPFSPDSPFYGLEIPEDVTVNRQVLAEPVTELDTRTWARLEDGTPLVTSARRGSGRVILFHVTATPDWSNLPLSGLFPQMMARIAPYAGAGSPGEAETESAAWRLETALGADGRLTSATGEARIPPDGFPDARAAAETPPGVYIRSGAARALNILEGNDVLTPLPSPPSGLALVTDDGRTSRPLGGVLLAAALALFIVDALAAGALAGALPRLRRRGLAAAAAGGLAVVVALGVFSSAAHAQTSPSGVPEDVYALEALAELRLAYVLTGDRRIDEMSHAGLAGISYELTRRTSIEPAEPLGVDVERDEIALLPILFWVVTPDTVAPSPEAAARLDQFLRTGGVIVFDTRDADVAALRGGAPHPGLFRILDAIDVPALEPVPSDHVMTRSFYLMQDFPGRLGVAPVWVEVAGQSSSRDGVSSVIVGSADWAAAWALDENNRPLAAMSGSGDPERQRELAVRVGVNLLMYVLTGNYKADQVHLPAILERLGQ